MKNLLKKLSPLFALVMAFMMCCSLVACGQEEKTSFQEEFADYLKLDSKNGTIILESGIKTHLWHFEKELEYPNRVWLHLNYNTEENGGWRVLYNWIQSSVQSKKTDLQAIGDKVVQFAKESGWSNDYYLYISLCYNNANCEVHYDYETDEIYIPKSDDLFIEMYDKFNSCSLYEIEDTEKGQEWLVSKGLGFYKHGEFEFRNYYALESMYIWCYEGEFSIGQREKSNVY